MPWFRVDDAFPRHRKLELLEEDAAEHAMAVALWTLCGADSMDRLTDGLVSRARLARLLPFWPAKMRERAAAALVRCGLWEAHPDGWAFHDWLDMQPSAESIRREREASRRRQAEWKKGRRSGGSNGGGNAPPNASGDAASNGVTPPVATPAPSRPVPSQPIPDRSSLRSSRESAREAEATERSIAEMACDAWTKAVNARGGNFQPDPSRDASRFRAIGAVVDARRGEVPIKLALFESAAAHLAQRRTGSTPEYWLEWLNRLASRGTAPQSGVSAPESFQPVDVDSLPRPA